MEEADQADESINNNDIHIDNQDENENEEIYRVDENVDEDNDEQSVSNNTFDMDLATSHAYLGNDLEILHGRTFLDNGIYVNLPLWLSAMSWSNEIVLFPGQTLPIIEHNPHLIEMFRKCITRDRTFGVACEIDVNCIGTTAEIYEYSENPNISEIRVKAKGRQRFKILKLRNTSSRFTIVADVKILPEITLPSLFSENRLVSFDHLRVIPTNEESAKKYRKLVKKESIITPWPSWVYDQYDSRLLSMKIHKYLQFVQTRFIAGGSSIPTDPTNLSFWVAQNVLITPKDVKALLKQDCAISRLQIEAKLLSKLTDQVLLCKQCHIQIAKQTDVFPMNQEGIQSAYVNSHGAIHETVTLLEVQSVLISAERPSTDCSWFPGYAWTIVACVFCGLHLGWRFTATQSDLKLRIFWGLRRAALTWETD